MLFGKVLQEKDVIEILLLFNCNNSLAHGKVNISAFHKKNFHFERFFLLNFQCHISCRNIQRDVNSSGNEPNSSESSENKLTVLSLSKNDPTPVRQLTDEEIENIKKDLSKELTPLQVQKFGEILSKFKVGTNAEDHLEGMVSNSIQCNTKPILL